MYRVAFLTVILIGQYLDVFGQPTLYPGYVTFSDGQIKYGSIALKSNYQNSQSVLFIAEDSSEETFHPFEIESYRVEGNKYYLSKEVNIDGESRKVFLEYLVKGIVSLYFLEDKHTDYYFIEKEGEMYPLFNSDRQVNIDKEDAGGQKIDHFTSRVYITETNQYKGALRYLFSDSPEVFNQVRELPFEYESIINITKDYHHSVCQDYDCIDYTRDINDYLFIEPTLSLMMTTISIKGHDGRLRNMGIEVGAYLRNKLKKSDRQSLLIGLLFSRNTFSGDLNPNLNLEASYGTMRIPMLLEWLLPGNEPLTFFQFGLSNAIVPVIKEDVVFERTTPYFGQRKLEFGLALGTGTKIKLSENTLLSIRLDTDYRIPSVQLDDFLDKKRLFTVRVGATYSYKLK
jgi:hypothetical protein